ncbi:MAG TPA: hypothetical protein VH196_10425 [Terriglobales bacterium]|jgi:hypothetical protein|nr:hypothetical protein [Terriglobales bacterium]
MWKRYIALTFAALAGVLLASYLGDYAFLSLRIHHGDNAFGSVTVRRYYAVPQKSGKIEFLHADPQEQNCVHSLFPHKGDAPCWYMLRHTEQRIDM